MSNTKRKDTRDLDACYDYESFVSILDDKIKGWTALSSSFEKVKTTGAASSVTQSDMAAFQKFLLHVQEYFNRNRSAAGDFTVWQTLRLYALTLETLAGLITETYMTSVLSKLDTKGIIDKEVVLAEAKKMQAMSDQEYCNHILKECELLISDIQSDDRVDGLPADPKLEDYKLQIVALHNTIKQQGSAVGPDDRQKVDQVVGQAMEYTLNKMTGSKLFSSSKFGPAPVPGKPGSDLN